MSPESVLYERFKDCKRLQHSSIVLITSASWVGKRLSPDKSSSIRSLPDEQILFSC
jgi:hypothetical protein